MQYVNTPFYVELLPESPEELQVAMKAFGVKEVTRTIMVPAVTEVERSGVRQAFRAAMSGKG